MNDDALPLAANEEDANVDASPPSRGTPPPPPR